MFSQAPEHRQSNLIDTRKRIINLVKENYNCGFKNGGHGHIITDNWITSPKSFVMGRLWWRNDSHSFQSHKNQKVFIIPSASTHRNKRRRPRLAVASFPFGSFRSAATSPWDIHVKRFHTSDGIEFVILKSFLSGKNSVVKEIYSYD